MQQVCLFNKKDFVIEDNNVINLTKKRVRYKTPTYIKKYQLKRFNEFTNEWVYDSDEKHIFRYKTMQDIYSMIYNQFGFNPFEKFEIKEVDNILCHGEDMQAEIKGTQMLSLKLRLKLHIKLLKLFKRSLKGEIIGSFRDIYNNTGFIIINS